MTLPGAGYVTWNGYEWTRPESVLLPGGATKSYVYDPLMRVKEIAAQDKDSNGIVSYAYNYDRMDNIKNKNTEHGNYDYDYDDLYRLTDVDNPTIDDEGFGYDPVGNRLTSTAVAGAWTYNDNNELQSYNGVTFAYDNNGNTTRKLDASTVWTYTYNVEDRMISAENSTTTAEYYYDPFGRRLWKDVDGVRTCYMYSDEGLAAEMDASGNVTKTYGWKPDGTWGTDPLFMKAEGEYYYYHNDHLGTPQKLTDADGATVWSALYTSFGEAQVVPASTITNNLRFPGQYYEAETGLHYNFWRYYDSNSGRYLSNDPIGMLNNDINLFGYTNNNPENWTDVLGLFTRRCTEEKKRFFDWLYKDIKKLAQELNVDEDFLLALAANEGGWTKGNLDYNQPLNNPFGVNYIKNRQAAGNRKYNSLSEALNSWKKMFGERVEGAKTAQDFIDGLQCKNKPCNKYNDVNEDYEEQYLRVYESAKGYKEACMDICNLE